MQFATATPRALTAMKMTSITWRWRNRASQIDRDDYGTIGGGAYVTPEIIGARMKPVPPPPAPPAPMLTAAVGGSPILRLGPADPPPPWPPLRLVSAPPGACVPGSGDS